MNVFILIKIFTWVGVTSFSSEELLLLVSDRSSSLGLLGGGVAGAALPVILHVVLQLGVGSLGRSAVLQLGAGSLGRPARYL